jgi:hypothetical protein
MRLLCNIQNFWRGKSNLVFTVLKKSIPSIASAFVDNGHNEKIWLYDCPFVANLTLCSPFTFNANPVTLYDVTLVRLILAEQTPGWISDTLDPVSITNFLVWRPSFTRIMGAWLTASNRTARYLARFWRSKTLFALPLALSSTSMIDSIWALFPGFDF